MPSLLKCSTTMGLTNLDTFGASVHQKPILGEGTAKVELKKLETAEVVAPLLGLSKQALYEAVRRKIIPCVKIGHRIRFNPDALAEWVVNGGKALDGSEQR